MNGNEVKKGDGFRNTSNKFFPASRKNGQTDLVVDIIMDKKQKKDNKEKTPEDMIKRLNKVIKNTTINKNKENATFAISLLQPLSQQKNLSLQQKTNICAQIKNK